MLCPKEEHAADDDVMQRIILESTEAVKMPEPSLSELLFPQDSPEVMMWIESWNRKSEARFTWWQADYLSFVRDAGYESLEHLEREAVRLTPYRDILPCFLQKVQPREKVCLQWCFLQCVSSPPVDETVAHVWDLYQSLSRVPKQKNKAPTVLPASFFWIYMANAQNRPVIPPEYMRIQGMWWCEHGINVLPKQDGDPNKPFTYTWREVVDLAGNSFNAFAAAFSMMTGVAAWKPAS